MFLLSKGNKNVSGTLPHPRLIELNRLTFFWDKLGLNKLDLDLLSPEWKDEIYMAGLGSERARSELSATSSSGGVGTTHIVGNKKIEKIL